MGNVFYKWDERDLISGEHCELKKKFTRPPIFLWGHESDMILYAPVAFLFRFFSFHVLYSKCINLFVLEVTFRGTKWKSVWKEISCVVFCCDTLQPLGVRLRTPTWLAVLFNQRDTIFHVVKGTIGEQAHKCFRITLKAGNKKAMYVQSSYFIEIQNAYDVIFRLEISIYRKVQLMVSSIRPPNFTQVLISFFSKHNLFNWRLICILLVHLKNGDLHVCWNGSLSNTRRYF